MPADEIYKARAGGGEPAVESRRQRAGGREPARMRMLAMY